MNNQIIKKLSKNRFLLVVILLIVFSLGGSLVLSVVAGENNNNLTNNGNQEEEQEEKKNSYDSFALQTMKNQLLKNGIDDFTLSIKEQEEGRTLALKYKTNSEQESFEQEMALIAGTFIGIKNYNEWDVGRFEATIKDNEEDIKGTWHIAEKWLEDYNNGDMSDEDFVSKIIDSYQSI
jgi:hypothetical protein